MIKFPIWIPVKFGRWIDASKVYQIANDSNDRGHKTTLHFTDGTAALYKVDPEKCAQFVVAAQVAAHECETVAEWISKLPEKFGTFDEIDVGKELQQLYGIKADADQ